MQKRTYLPRSTIDFTAMRAIFAYAEDNSVPFGKALEKLLLDSEAFKNSLNKLSEGSEWFKKDVDEFVCGVGAQK